MTIESMTCKENGTKCEPACAALGATGPGLRNRPPVPGSALQIVLENLGQRAASAPGRAGQRPASPTNSRCSARVNAPLEITGSAPSGPATSVQWESSAKLRAVRAPFVPLANTRALRASVHARHVPWATFCSRLGNRAAKRAHSVSSLFWVGCRSLV